MSLGSLINPRRSNLQTHCLALQFPLVFAHTYQSDSNMYNRQVMHICSELSAVETRQTCSNVQGFKVRRNSHYQSRPTASLSFRMLRTTAKRLSRPPSQTRGVADLVVPPRSKPVISYGPAGRSSVSGHVATVFGCSGQLGRYLVSKLGEGIMRLDGIHLVLMTIGCCSEGWDSGYCTVS